MAKIYILQKDLPNAKAGSKYKQTENEEEYVCYDLVSSYSWDVSYPKRYVETNPEWFKEYIPKTYTEEDMRKCFKEARNYHPLTHWKHTTFNDYLKTL